jgi:phosphatidylserine decarboxylase
MKTVKKILWVLLALAIVLVLYYRLWFLRQPDRHIPNNNSVFVAPANGKVVSVKRWTSDNVLVTKGELGVINVWTKDVDTAGTIISIQMDVTNVHYQRSPVAGKVISEHYQKGNFRNAVVMSNEYGIRFENEHNEILFETNEGVRCKIVQIAGFLARRIEDYVQPQQVVKQGDVVGLIKLGSQVTVLLPHHVHVKVKTGDTTVDGETVLAEQ